MNSEKVLVIGSTGKTGRRVVERLENKGIAVRSGSRSSEILFDWENPETWKPALDGIESVYITFYPDLAVPGADEAIQALVDLARSQGVKRLVLLSGRGEEGAQACENIIKRSGLEWTIVRASWFLQNFSEGMLLSAIQGGTLALPVNGIREAFIDVDDIADVVTAALTDDRHIGNLYEVTGPRLMSFTEVAEEFSSMTGKELKFLPITPEQMTEHLEKEGLPIESAEFITELMMTTMDGRNEYLSDGVFQALGRPPKDFRDYVQDTLKTGVWG